MDLSAFADQFAQKMKEIEDFVNGDDIKDIMGVEAVNHFKESFKNEGFTDESLEKWKDVKRRDPDSPWYGRSGQTGKFSQARTAAKILTGETEELQSSLSYDRTAEGARVTNAAPYASVHQFGITDGKAFGKYPFTLAARPFVGKSVVLIKNIEEKITTEIKQILTK